MIPPMGQAALGIEIVSGDPKIKEIALSLNDENTFLCTKLERDFVSKIGAGCSAPVAVNATLDGDVINLEAMVGYPDGSHIMHKNITALVTKCDHLGEQLASDFIAEGAMDILENAEKLAFKEEMPQRI